MVPYKKFNVVEKGHGSLPRELKNRGDGRGPLQCWICSKDHHKKDCPLYQGGIPQIYIAHEAHIVGMLVITFIIFVQLWTISRKIIMHPLLRWKASSLVELFLF